MTRLRFALRAALLLAGGCSSSDGGRIDREGYETPSSSCGFNHESLERLRTQLGADWVGIRGNYQIEAGSACGTAADPTGCHARIQEAAGTLVTPPEGSGYALIVNRGDDVRVHGADGNLLAPIDTSVKAFFFLEPRGWSIDCNRWIRSTSEGFEVIASTMTDDCDPIVTAEQKVLVKRDGSITVLSSTEISREEGVCVGRRYEGMTPLAARERDPLANHFARSAYLEAASVHAFRRLRHELAAHGAPRALLAAAENAAEDEIRHAAIMTRLAARFGGRAQRPAEARFHVRSLFEVTLENAVEGCVRETYGALEATWQAHRARDPEIAAAMRTIAEDETRHAELSWQIAQWASARLNEAERAAIAAAMQTAIVELSREIARQPPASLCDAAGMPSADQALRAHSALYRSICVPSSTT